MKAKLVDFKSETKVVDYGTCEICMSTGKATFEKILFEYDDGHTEWIDLWYWGWGDLFRIHIENMADFAQWLSKKELDGYIGDYSNLDRLVLKYEDGEMD
ncbi:hypothetical protein ACEN19_11215 [Corynebacterium auriscanis]|uniref:hypothetical protein n=1 Tax=Corynebacterium auriscanis TaxID=99807 RepID=UPI003CF6A94E